MILDVGCSGNMHGDVNVDIKKPCDVLATIYNLPFYKRAFSKVMAHHVLEHLEKPGKALDELMRVARVVELTVPHAYMPYSHQDRTHKQFFTSAYFKNYARARNLNVQGRLKLDFEHGFFIPQLEFKCWLWRCTNT